MLSEALRVADILLLSEHPDEAELVRTAASIRCVHVVRACADVLPFLRHQGRFRNSPRPDLIMLDLDLSRDDDCDTLIEIKQDAQLRRIPLVVLAKSDQSRLAGRAYDLRANAYIGKPNTAAEFVEVIRGVLRFWLELARLPGQGE
jgi:chemotaxis family two-component system response regulator Rcp1